MLSLCITERGTEMHISTYTYITYIYMFVNVQKTLYKDLHQTFTSGSCENGDEFGEGVKEGFSFP